MWRCIEVTPKSGRFFVDNFSKKMWNQEISLLVGAIKLSLYFIFYQIHVNFYFFSAKHFFSIKMVIFSTIYSLFCCPMRVLHFFNINAHLLPTKLFFYVCILYHSFCIKIGRSILLKTAFPIYL